MARKRRRIAFGFIALVLAVVVATVAVEGAVRLRQWLKYGSASPTVHTFDTDPVSGLRIPRPNMTRAGIAINSRGFRGPEITVPKPEGTIRLVFLGASTTYCAEVSGNEAVWAELVTDSLSTRFPEERFDYVNGGVPGYTTVESLQNLSFRIAGLEPDVIVIYHATNDLAGDTRRLARDLGLESERPDDMSALAEWSTFWFLLEKNWTVYQRQANARSGNNRLEFQPQELSRAFHERLRALVKEAKETAPVVAVATFSHQVRHGQTDAEKLQASNTSLYYMPYMSVEGLLRGFDEYNRVIRRVAADETIILVESAEAIPGDGVHFVDSVHFTDQGSRRMASSVGETLAAAGPFVELVEHTRTE